jgi:hypothetical protein
MWVDGDTSSTLLTEVEHGDKQPSATSAVGSPPTRSLQEHGFAVNSLALSTKSFGTLEWTLYCLVLHSESADTSALKGLELDSGTTSTQLGTEPNLSL